MPTLRLSEWEVRPSVALDPVTAAFLRTRFQARVEPAVVRSDGGASLWDVTAGSVVGALRVGEQDVVVTPKIDVDNVLFLVAVGSGRDPWQAAEDARLGRTDHLASGVASLFVRLTLDALNRGVLRGYRREEADLMTVRGRVDIAEQLRRRPGTLLPLAVRYAEHDEDVLENRLLLAATQILFRVPGLDRHVLQGLHRVRSTLAGVTPAEFPAVRVPEVVWDRLNGHYRPAVELARTILGGEGIDIEAGGVQALGITLDMAKIFEDFVCTALARTLRQRGGTTRPQDSWRLDVDGTVRLRPDLVWYGANGTPRAVVDAKYKREKPAGYPEADVYQLLAYCTALDLPEGHLVYAQGNDEARTVRVVHGGPVIHAHALDLTSVPPALMAQVEVLAELIAAARSPLQTSPSPTEPR